MSEKDTVNESAVTPTSSKLVVHKTFSYDTATGVRSIFRGAAVWEPESDAEFIERVQTDDVDLPDFERIVKLHPLIQEYTAQGKDFEAVITGILSGCRFSTIFKTHGFHSWGTFRNMTEFACPGLKKFFNLVLDAREVIRLEDAEEALRTRAIKGVQEEVYTQSGKLAGTRTKYSDRLLEMHLKALDPEKYSEKSNGEVKGLVVQVNMGLREPVATAQVREV